MGSGSLHPDRYGSLQGNLRADLGRELRRNAQDFGCEYAAEKGCMCLDSKMEVSEDGGVWTIKTSTTLKTMELKFKLGGQFDETTPDGREVTAVVNLEGGKIITVQKAKKDSEKSTKSVREMNGADEMIYTMTIDGSDLVCVQKFKRI